MGEHPLGQGHPGDHSSTGLVRCGQDLLQRLVSEYVDDELYARAAGMADRLECLFAGLRAHAVGADSALGDQVIEQVPDMRCSDELVGRAVQLNQVDGLNAKVLPGAIVPVAEVVAAVVGCRRGDSASHLRGHHELRLRTGGEEAAHEAL